PREWRGRFADRWRGHPAVSCRRLRRGRLPVEADDLGGAIETHEAEGPGDILDGGAEALESGPGPCRHRGRADVRVMVEAGRAHDGDQGHRGGAPRPLDRLRAPRNQPCSRVNVRAKVAEPAFDLLDPPL